MEQWHPGTTSQLPSGREAPTSSCINSYTANTGTNDPFSLLNTLASPARVLGPVLDSPEQNRLEYGRAWSGRGHQDG